MITLDDIVNVIVNVSPVSVAAPEFNTGLILGPNATFTGLTKVYTGVNDMLADGFTASMDEYKAASLYFGAAKKPSSVVIGKWNGTDKLADAIAACRADNTDWYGCTIAKSGLQDSDIQAVSEFIESAYPDSTHFYTCDDPSIFAEMQSLGFHRSLGQYSTLTPNAAAAALGYAMGANVKTVNSAFTLAYKTLPGVKPEAIDFATLKSIKDDNGNVYLRRGTNRYSFEQGWMSDGTPFDEVLGLDMLSASLQNSVMDLLQSSSKVPQTDAGVAQLYGAVVTPCESAMTTGFISPGVWNGPAIIDLNPGDTLTAGYRVMSEPFINQSQTDRDKRLAPPIYVAAKLAGSIEHVIIQVNVNR